MHPDLECDCCGNRSNTMNGDRMEEIRHALRSDGSFIGEAIGNGDLTDLVEGFNKVDPQATWDAIHDLVGQYLAEQERSLARTYPYPNEEEVLEKLAAVFGVAS